MIKTKNVENKMCVFLIVAFFIVTSIISANAQQNQQSNFQLYTSLSYQQVIQPVWEVEYSHALTALRVATDSYNNVILVGPSGGEGVTELPYGAIVKYGPDGDFIWSDKRSAPIISGSVLKSYDNIFLKQSFQMYTTISITPSLHDSKTLPIIKSSKGVIINLEERYQNFEPPSLKAQSSLGKWVRFYDVAVDSNDDIIVVGEIQHRFTEDLRTVYVIKYDSEGHVLWDKVYKRYLLSHRDLATSVAIDSNDNIFVSIRSQEKDSEDYKGWVLKLSSDSGLKLGESIYQGKSAIFYDLAIDSNDNVFVAGYYPMTGAMKVVKYSNSLNLLDEWGLPTLPIEPWGIDADPNNNVVVAGSIGFSSQKKQYIVKFSSDGDVLWSSTSTEYGELTDVVSISHNITAVTGSGDGEISYRFYVGLYDENGIEFKRLLGGDYNGVQAFLSYGLDADNNGDIVVAGFRNYYYYQFYMYAMKFHQ